MKRILVGFVTTVLITASVPVSVAHAACAADPNALTFRQMIAKGKTGNKHFSVMFMGKVAGVKDVGGKRGGDTIARIAVAAHPVGFAPLISRVHFYKPPPGVGVEDNLEFHHHHKYVVIARRQSDGSFVFDGGCGQTAQVHNDRFHRLVGLARP